MAASDKNSEKPAWKRPRTSDLQNDEEERITKMSEAIKTLIECMGEDIERDGLLKTPERAAKAMLYFTKGYGMSAEEEANNALFDIESNKEEEEDEDSESDISNVGMVVVRDIEISSLCEHHLVPFIGRVHIGYLPNKKILGLSKLVRIAEVYSRRLQVQERLTKQIATALNDITKPVGVGVVIECSHMCMCMRGVRQPGAMTSTTFFIRRISK
mmetsp:Transcript_7921/g.10239  ORF Transcript_7921/g.10239 Transcript_7921/m.10239 type:complete len:214 (+) Transcript_7921:13-654(+)